MCKFMYVNDEFRIQIYEDYLYIFIENMFGRLEKLPQIKEKYLFGMLGKWQEYFYFESAYIEKHLHEIEAMEKAIFISAESYGTFLYEYENLVWIEINNGYDDKKSLLPMEYYRNCINFRILLAPLSKDDLADWSVKLKEIKRQFV